MRVVGLAKGMSAVWRGRLVTITKVDDLQHVSVQDVVTLEANKARVDDLEPVRLPALDQTTNTPDLASIPERDWEIARRREAVIVALLQHGETTKHLVRQAAHRFGASLRTLYRWLSQYRADPRTSSLLPAKRGNPLGASRLGPVRERIVQTVIGERYLQRPGATVADVVEEIRLRCTVQDLTPVSRKSVLLRLSRLAPESVVRRREGAKAAEQRHRSVTGTFKVERPLQVVQIDHTPVDIIVVDDFYRRPLGRPWVTLAIDVATRVVLGFYLSVEAPSATSVALCITHACSPKERWLEQRKLAVTWPVYGLPESLHLDNAQEFHSEALRRGCEQHKIGLKYRPVGQPRFGGHIERLIGTLMGRVHLLPGTTAANVKARGDYPSEEQAVMTLHELEAWLTLEICNHYHATVHRTLGVPPLAAWQAGFREGDSLNLPPLVVDRERFVIDFLPIERRRIRRDGIRLFHIHYWEDVLSTWIGREEKAIIRYDPRNLARIYVLTPDNQYRAIAYADIRRPPITLWEHQAALAYLKEQAQSHIDEHLLFDTIEKQRKLVAASAGKTKQVRKALQRQRNSFVDHPSSFDTKDTDQSSSTTVDYTRPATPLDFEEWT